jgi:glycosyltransferase involved in cell wall biosynthesis
VTRPNELISVDVILPVFNGAKYLKQAIESVIEQEGNFHINIFAVDDNSTDSSVEILQEQKNFIKNMIIYEKTSNTGVSSTRNLGISLGNSEYVAFIDQDDVWVKSKLIVQLKSLHRNDDIEYSIGFQKFFLENTNHKPKWFREKWLSEPQVGYLPSTLIVKRNLFKDIGKFDERYKHGGDDIDWFARARRAGIKNEIISSVIVNRRIHSDNLSSKMDSNTEILDLVRNHSTTAENG